jgi:hypothetical protein
MTLLITFIAAIIVTVIWYTNSGARELGVGLMCYMYWGASLMWFVDAIFEYAEMGAEYFTPAAADMLNDAYLGLCVAVLGLIIWLVTVLIKDPKGILKAVLTKK